MRAPQRAFFAALAVLGLVAASCGDDDDSDATDTTSAATTAADRPRRRRRGRPATSRCSPPPRSTDAFDEIGTAFSAANPDAAATFNFAASSELVTQINEGAPADVFASADQNNMKKLTDVAGNAGEPEIFATNLLEIIVAPGNPLGITGVADLANPDLIVVTCAAEVPCGTYAAGDLHQRRRDGDAGLARGERRAPWPARSRSARPTPASSTAPTSSPPAIRPPASRSRPTSTSSPSTRSSPRPSPGNPETAAAFVDFVLGDEGQAILASYGFSGP